jgi:hypothetical protein
MLPRRLAGAAVVVYVAIQAIQEWVYSRLPETHTPVDELLQGPLTLNVVRATLMLLSFFPMIFAYQLLGDDVALRRPLLARLGAGSLTVFCVFEIALRSVELFYVSLELPSAYAAASTPELRAALLDRFATFGSIQHALYFPLMSFNLVGSALLAAGLGRSERAWLASGSLSLNAVRLTLRLCGMFLGVSAFDALTGSLYFPLVLAVKVPLAVYFFGRAPSKR